MTTSTPATRREQIPVPAATTFNTLAVELGRDEFGMHELCRALQVGVHGRRRAVHPSDAQRLRQAHHDELRRQAAHPLCAL